MTSWFAAYQEFAWLVFGPVISVALAALVPSAMILAVVRLAQTLWKGG